MTSRVSRREFLAQMGAVAAATSSIPHGMLAAARPFRSGRRMESPFRISVINDEISQDFGRACELAAREFGMRWIELRGMWNKNIVNLDAKEIAEAQRILKRYELRVTDIASPLFKVDWPGAPKSKFSPDGPQFGADFTFDQQDDVLARSIALARTFGAGRVRCFDFWRLDDPAPYRSAMNQTLHAAAEKAGERGVILVLENDAACSTGTAAEAAKVLEAVQSPNFMLNWDPGNAAERGETPYPNGYHILPKNRIGHCHCKDAIRKPGGGYAWAAVGRGLIDWAGQFRALLRDGYRYAVSLETHWRGAGTPEESTRQSWVGMREALEKAGALEDAA
jgi:L-ribulose-5-phosphate 3-epimerase